MISSLENTKKPRFSLLHRKYVPYVFISPFFVLFLVFGVFPTFYGLVLSFTKTRLTELNTMPWNGLENYVFTLFKDAWFWKAVTNTLILGVYGLLIQPIAVTLAFTIHMSLKRWRGFVTAMYFLPYITSTVAVSIIFSMVFSERVGIINATLSVFNNLPLLGAIIPDEKIRWLGDPNTIKPVIAIVVLWKYLGWNVLLYLSRLQSIPLELYEAARVDGATTWQQFWNVTIPQLRGVIFFNITLTIIGQMQLFDEPYTMVGKDGGAAQSGLTVAMYLFTTMTEYREAGTAAAMGWILFAFILVLTLFNNRIFGSEARARGD
jgi:multiple sugar transport system permease protein